MNEHCCHVPSVQKKKVPQPRFSLAVLGIILAAVSMLFSMPELFGLEAKNWMPWLSFGFSLPVCLGMGWRFWLAIPKLFWKANMNTLVGLGIAASYGLSFWQWSRGETQHLYFDSAAFIAAFVSLGHEMEKLIQKRIFEQLPDWMSFLPAVAHRKDSATQDVPLQEVKPGDILVIRPGERIPLDVKLLSDIAEIDEALITGEARPITKNRGDFIAQGSLNLSQPIEVEVEKKLEESYYQVLARRVEESLQKKSNVQRKVDRWAAILTPAVVLISAVTAFYWGYLQKEWDLMIQSSVSVLVIACPCALGIATPISLFVGLIRAARRGVLLNHLDVVERYQEVNVIAFDKTGTLTMGSPQVENLYAIENVSQKDLLQWAGSLEQRSEHPYARAILKRCEEDKISLLKAHELRVSAGKGIIGKIEKDKKLHEVCIGNIVWLFENGVESTQIPENLRWEAEGTPHTVLWLAVDQKVHGILILSDQIREGARELIQKLQDESYEVGLITGDSENVARQVAKELNLKFFHYGVVPEEKATLVKRLSEKRKKGLDFIFPKVAFVGDGINDAPALAQAHLGIALGSGTALAQTTADVILTQNRLESIGELFQVLKETNSLLKQNLWMAFIYNLVAIPVAAGVLYPFLHIHLDPGIAALAMSLSSVSLLVNSLRVLRR